MSARRSGNANKTKDGTKPETKQPNDYLAPWMKPVPKKGRRGRRGKEHACKEIQRSGSECHAWECGSV